MRVALGYGFARYLLGDEMADHLRLPKTPARHVTPVLRRVIGRAEWLGRRSRRYATLARRAGEAYWERSIALGLQGKAAGFAMPTSLPGFRDVAAVARGA
jgi:hypothetical protein